MAGKALQGGVRMQVEWSPLLLLLLACFMHSCFAATSYGQAQVPRSAPNLRAASVHPGVSKSYYQREGAAALTLEQVPFSLESSSSGLWAPIHSTSSNTGVNASLWVAQELGLGQLYAGEEGGVLQLSPAGEVSVSGGLISVGAGVRPAILHINGCLPPGGRLPNIQVTAEEWPATYGALFEPEWEVDCTGGTGAGCKLRIGGRLLVPSGIRPGGVIRMLLRVTVTN
ncbi:MAG: hypothetical protein NXI25_02545 [bacterium]|nr:hypothetical protein [bacterium]